MNPSLQVVVYHYVRDLPHTRFPRIKGMLTDSFRRQVKFLQTHYEMAILESAVAFWRGEYRPRRNLCLLTFDDGLKDHYTDVFPVLAERRIQGLFFIITACLEEGRVVSAHKNHFLMASLEFDVYRRAFLRRLKELSPGADLTVDIARAQATYRWDTADVAAFKYLLNFRLAGELRDRITDQLFAEGLGHESDFAQQLYLSWDQAQEMQRTGMVMGGHSHAHVALATLTADRQRRDLERCANILRRRLHEQAHWPFSYPFGKQDSFDEETVRLLKQKGFDLAFSTVSGETRPGHDLYALRREDTNSIAAGMGATGNYA